MLEIGKCLPLVEKELTGRGKQQLWEHGGNNLSLASSGGTWGYTIVKTHQSD